MSVSDSLLRWILTSHQARQAYLCHLCSLPHYTSHLPHYMISHLSCYINHLPCSFHHLSCHPDPLSCHLTSTCSLNCPPHLLNPLPHLLDPLVCLLDPLTHLLGPLVHLVYCLHHLVCCLCHLVCCLHTLVHLSDPLLYCLGPLVCPLDCLLCCLHCLLHCLKSFIHLSDPLLCCPHPRHLPLHLLLLFLHHAMRLCDPACSQMRNSSTVLTRSSMRSLLIASLSICLMLLLSIQRQVMGETLLLPTSSIFTLTHSITHASTSNIHLEMDMVDMGKSLARCCGTCQASQLNAQSCAHHIGCFFFLCNLALGLIFLLTGRGLRYCSFCPYTLLTHSFTSHQAMAILPNMAASYTASCLPTDDVHMEVFHKTLAFYCALVVKGCAFASSIDFLDSII